MCITLAGDPAYILKLESVRIEYPDEGFKINDTQR